MVGRLHQNGGQLAFTATGELFASWRQWCERRSLVPGSANTLSAATADRGFTKKRAHGGVRGFQALTLKKIPADLQKEESDQAGGWDHKRRSGDFGSLTVSVDQFGRKDRPIEHRGQGGSPTRMAVEDVTRHVDGLRRAARAAGQEAPAFINYEDPVPEAPGDGSGVVVSLIIGDRGELTRQRAKVAARSWRKLTARYPRIHIVVCMAGWDQDPRELCHIDEARAYVCRWARFAGIASIDDAEPHLDAYGLGFLAACGVFGEDIRRRVRVPPAIPVQ